MYVVKGGGGCGKDGGKNKGRKYGLTFISQVVEQTWSFLTSSQ